MRAVNMLFLSIIATISLISLVSAQPSSSLSQVGTTAFPSGESTGISTYTPLSLFQMTISGENTNGFNGEYFISEALLNNEGLQFVAQPTGSQLVGWQNVSGTQVNNIKIYANENQILYPVDSGQVANLYTYELVPYQGQVSFKDCNLQSQTLLGSQAMSSSCLINSTGAYYSYFYGCKNAPEGNSPIPNIPVIINSSTDLSFISLGKIGTISVNVGFGDQVECYTLQAIPYATIYNFGTPVYNLSDSINVNNVSLTVNENQNVATYTYPNGTIGLQLRLLNPQIHEPIPYPDQIGTVIFYSQNASRLGDSLSSFAGSSVLISYVSTTTFTSTWNSAKNTFDNYLNTLTLNNQGQAQLGYANLGNVQLQVVTLDQQVVAPLLNSTQSQYQGMLDINDLNQINDNYLLVLNDYNGQFIQPVVQLITNFKILGLSFLSAKCSIISTNPQSFSPSGIGVESITVQNTGKASGGCSANVTSTDNDLYSITQEQNSGTLQPGSTTTFNFQMGYKDYLNASKNDQITFTVCDTATMKTCNSTTAALTIDANCQPNTIVQNSNTCKPIVAPPTAAIPNQTTQNLQNPNNTNFSSTGAEGQSSPTNSSSNGSNSLFLYLLGIIIAIIAIGGYFFYNRNKSSDSSEGVYTSPPVSSKSHEHETLAELKEQYISGEITEKQYLKMKKEVDNVKETKKEENEALKALKKRYTKGEITEKEYLRIKKDLEE